METEASKPKKRTTIYVEPNIHREFKTICFREDVSISEKLEGYMAKYVAIHMEGNPQLILERFTEPTKKKCYFCEDKFPGLIKVKFISGLVAPICKECLEEAKIKKGTVKKILGKV